MGFGAPIGRWFRGDLREYMRDRLLASDARYRDMLSGPFVEGLVAQHLAGRAHVGQQLWSLICFERWLRARVESSRATGDDLASLTSARATRRRTPAR